MKKTILMLLSAIALSVVLSIPSVQAQETKEPWPGVTAKVLTENEHVKITEVTFAPGAVADWHDHPIHTVYALTDVNMKEELKDKEPGTIEVKAGQATYFQACHHKTTNMGKKPAKVIVTEIKETEHKH